MMRRYQLGRCIATAALIVVAGIGPALAQLEPGARGTIDHCEGRGGHWNGAECVFPDDNRTSPPSAGSSGGSVGDLVGLVIAVGSAACAADEDCSQIVEEVFDSIGEMFNSLFE